MLCVIVGKGPEKPKIIKLIKKLTIENNVNIIEYVPHNELLKYFSSCDAFVISSVRESLGVVMIEAASAMKPVVTTNMIGAKELIVNEYNGFVSPIKDFKALANNIIKLLNNPKLINKMGINNYNHIKKMGFLNDSADCLPLVKSMWENAIYRYNKIY